MCPSKSCVSAGLPARRPRGIGPFCLNSSSGSRSRHLKTRGSTTRGVMCEQSVVARVCSNCSELCSMLALLCIRAFPIPVSKHPLRESTRSNTEHGGIAHSLWTDGAEFGPLPCRQLSLSGTSLHLHPSPPPCPWSTNLKTYSRSPRLRRISQSSTDTRGLVLTLSMAAPRTNLGERVR